MLWLHYGDSMRATFKTRLSAITAVLFFLQVQRVTSFFLSSKAALNFGSKLQLSSITCVPKAIHYGHHPARGAGGKTRAARSAVTMERDSGPFQRLAKPKFDPQNPNAVLGEVEVPGLQEICIAAHVQLFPRREAVQWMKERLKAWCAEENRMETEGEKIALGPGIGIIDKSDRERRTWNAYELTQLPSRNRTHDSEILGMNVGLCVNDSRIDVTVDYGNKTEAPEVALRLQEMMAEVSAEANAVFGFEDNVASSVEATQFGPWKKFGNVNSWRKWLDLDSENELPESAVTIFRTVQANWAVPHKIAAAMNFTASWCKERFDESMQTPGTPLLRVEVFHSAVHPHVVKVMETYVSSDAFLDQYHKHYTDYLDGVAPFRAAVGPTVQCYTPLSASRRPCLSARLSNGMMIPMVAIGSMTEGEAPNADVMLEGLKIGLRHVVLEADSRGIGDAVAALEGAIRLGMVARDDLFLTLFVGEDLPRVDGADGLAGMVRKTLASAGGGGGSGGVSLGYVDALVLTRDSGRRFDDDDKILTMWEHAREAASYPAVAWDETSPSTVHQSPKPLVRALGIGGHGLLAYERLRFLAEKNRASKTASSETIPQNVPETDPGTLSSGDLESDSESGRSGFGVECPGMVPSVFWGDVGAGYGVANAHTMEFCRENGVQAFSFLYNGGQGGDVAVQRACGAADYEYEDVTADEILAKWVVELGGGVVWRPSEPEGAARTLPMMRYFMPPEWITEIAQKAGCTEADWARIRSRLLFPEGTPSDEELREEAERAMSGRPSDEEMAAYGDDFEFR